MGANGIEAAFDQPECIVDGIPNGTTEMTAPDAALTIPSADECRGNTKQAGEFVKCD